MPASTATIALPPRLSRAYLVRHRVCPARTGPDETLVVACAPPFSARAVGAIAQLFARPVTTEECSDAELDQLIERLATEADRADQIGAAGDIDDLSLEDVRELANQPPVARYVNFLVREAFDADASDIHLEATRRGLVARFRIDGVLQSAPEPPRSLQLAVVSRLKAMASLDVTERRRPQDGRIRVRLEERELDLRLATVPTIHGESVVLRLLDRGGRPVQLADLGMPAREEGLLAAATARPHGMILVTGPTGSGKTTTLYAALLGRAATAEKIITVEDPVEYHLDDVTQVPVHRQTGITFASVLRAILRQDPDVVMIGEMRDTETAEIAVQAAMTGHLVLSTLHTNDALSAIPRLVDLGIPPYLIAGTLERVVGQRLVRRLCVECCEERESDPARAALLAGRPVARLRTRHAVGCPACRGTGYRGRTGVFEVLAVGEGVRHQISSSASRAQLRDEALKQGFRPLNAHGWSLIEQGVTTIEEVLRVVQA